MTNDLIMIQGEMKLGIKPIQNILDSVIILINLYY